MHTQSDSFYTFVVMTVMTPEKHLYSYKELIWATESM